MLLLQRDKSFLISGISLDEILKFSPVRIHLCVAEFDAWDYCLYQILWYLPHFREFGWAVGKRNYRWITTCMLNNLTVMHSSICINTNDRKNDSLLVKLPLTLSTISMFFKALKRRKVLHCPRNCLKKTKQKANIQMFGKIWLHNYDKTSFNQTDAKAASSLSKSTWCYRDATGRWGSQAFLS